MCTEEDGSELMTELTRSWYYRETGHQITDVQGRLRANVGYRPLLLYMHKILGKSVVNET